MAGGVDERRGKERTGNGHYLSKNAITKWSLSVKECDHKLEPKA
jgi:hypothetical protein